VSREGVGQGKNHTSPNGSGATAAGSPAMATSADGAINFDGLFERVARPPSGGKGDEGRAEQRPGPQDDPQRLPSAQTPASQRPSAGPPPARGAGEATFQPPDRRHLNGSQPPVPATGKASDLYNYPDKNQQPVRRQGKLILDLDSHLVDVAVDWGRRRLVEGFQLAGKTRDTVETWSDNVMNGGRELKESHFEGNGIELDLSDSSCLGTGFAEMERLVSAFKKDITVTSLRLIRSQIDDIGANMLAGALMRNRTLRHLVLCQNAIGDEGTEALAAALDQNPSLHRLDLAENLIGIRGAKHLADGLKQNRGLTELDLSGNDIGDEGAGHLADVLDPDLRGGRSCMLARLSLAECNVDARGRGRLAKAFDARGSSLVFVDLGGEPRAVLRKKGADEREGPGKNFVITCSGAGVEITSEDGEKAQVIFDQDDHHIQITIKARWLKRKEKETVKIQFSPRKLQIEVRGHSVADMDLHGRTIPEESSWVLHEGQLQVTLAKWDTQSWPGLVRVSTGSEGI